MQYLPRLTILFGVVLLLGGACKRPSKECTNSQECGVGFRCVAGVCRHSVVPTQRSSMRAPMGSTSAPTPVAVKRPPACLELPPDPQNRNRGATHFHRRQLKVAFPAYPWRTKRIRLGKARIVAAPVEDKKGVLYVGDLKGGFYAFLPSGKILWRRRVGGAVWARALLSRDEKTLWVGSDDDHVYALSTATGAVTLRKLVFQCAPKKGTDPEHVRCDQDAALVRASDETIVTGGKGVARLDETGTVLWRYSLGSHVRSAAAVDTEGNLYFGTLGHQILSLDPMGNRRWAYRTRAQCDSTPALLRGCTVVAGCDDDALHALDMRTGKLKWRYLAEGDFRSGGAVDQQGTLYWGSTDHYLYALTSKGRAKWRYLTGGRILTPPVVDNQGRILVVPEERRLYLLSSRGELLYSHPLPFLSDGVPLVVQSGALVVPTERGVVLLLEPKK